MEDYNESVRFSSQELNSDMKRAMIERAVHPNRALRAVKDRETDRIAEHDPVRVMITTRTCSFLKKPPRTLTERPAIVVGVIVGASTSMRSPKEVMVVVVIVTLMGRIPRLSRFGSPAATRVRK